LQAEGRQQGPIERWARLMQKYNEVVHNGLTYHCSRKPKRFGALSKKDVDTPKKIKGYETIH
jgi:hypothetical protein